MPDRIRALLARPPGRPLSRCHWCGDPATVIVEGRLSRVEPGRPRGEALGSRTRRMCSNHATLWVMLLEEGPRALTFLEKLQEKLGV